jgi:hypothetical protein
MAIFKLILAFFGLDKEVEPPPLDMSTPIFDDVDKWYRETEQLANELFGRRER